MVFSQMDMIQSSHPVDIVEQIATLNDWNFDREERDEISIIIAGSFIDFKVSFTWLPGVETLHISCAFDMKTLRHTKQRLLELIRLINERLWIGHFSLWEKMDAIVYRHGFLLAGGSLPSQAQCEALLQTAIMACERYYSSFQFVRWSDKEAQEALTYAMYETVGEA